MAGYIKDHRKELDSDIWLMPPLYHRVWQYLKYKANHEQGEVRLKGGGTLTVLPGQHFTSVRAIAKGVSWKERGVLKEPNPKSIGDVLKWLEDQEMIVLEGVKSNTPSKKNADKGNSVGTLITLINWEKYQIESVTSNAKVTPRGVTSGTNNNKDIIITTTGGAYASESMNLPDELFSEKEPPVTKTPLIEILNAYCSLHNKIDLNVTDIERRTMRELAASMPTEFITSVMKKVYNAKREREGEVFDPPSTFTYYTKPIQKAWRAEQGSQTDAQVPALPSVAPGYSSRPRSSDKHLDARKREMALNQWIDGGGDPNEFVYRRA